MSVDIADIFNTGFTAVPQEGWAPLKVEFDANIPPDLIIDSETGLIYLIEETEVGNNEYLLIDSE